MTRASQQPGNSVPRRQPRRQGSIVFLSAARQPWGAEHSLALLTHEMAASAEVRVICDSSTTARFLNHRSIASVQLLHRAKGRLGQLRTFYHEVMRTSRESVVVIFSLQLVPLTFLLRADPRFRGAVVVDLHDVPKGRFDASASRLCSAMAHSAVAISEYVRQSFALPRAHCAVVPRPIESGTAHALSRQSSRTVGIVGRIDDEKRIDLAIRAIARCASDVRLAVFGAPMLSRPELITRLQALAAREVPGRVSFEGVVPVADIFKRIDALIVCNDNEPSGRSVGEAMAHGVLPVVPDRGGASEYLPAELRWLEYESGSASSAAERLDRVMDERNDLEWQRTLARDWIVERRSPPAIAADYLTVLRMGAGAGE